MPRTSVNQLGAQPVADRYRNGLQRSGIRRPERQLPEEHASAGRRPVLASMHSRRVRARPDARCSLPSVAKRSSFAHEVSPATRVSACHFGFVKHAMAIHRSPRAHRKAPRAARLFCKATGCRCVSTGGRWRTSRGSLIPKGRARTRIARRRSIALRRFSADDKAPPE